MWNTTHCHSCSHRALTLRSGPAWWINIFIVSTTKNVPGVPLWTRYYDNVFRSSWSIWIEKKEIITHCCYSRAQSIVGHTKKNIHIYIYIVLLHSDHQKLLDGHCAIILYYIYIYYTLIFYMIGLVIVNQGEKKQYIRPPAATDRQFAKRSNHTLWGSKQAAQLWDTMRVTHTHTHMLSSQNTSVHLRWPVSCKKSKSKSCISSRVIDFNDPFWNRPKMLCSV